MRRKERAWQDNGVVTRVEWHAAIDAEIIAVRARHAVRLAAEHARIERARQAVEDVAIVAAREQRVAHRRVRALVED